MARYLTEFVGTFLLVLLICLAQGALAPLAIGIGLMALVYMGGPVSGAHYNPAVSVGLLLRGAMPRRDFVPYVVAQLGGAVAAPVCAWGILGSAVAGPTVNATVPQALGAELLLTFALMLVILNVATVKAVANNAYYGLAIGATVIAGAFTVGGISGGAFNPAVGTGPALVAMIAGAEGALSNTWLYWVGPIAGAVLAFVVFKGQYPNGAADAEPHA